MKNQHETPEALAHELFTAAQLAPGEGIEDAVGRLAALVEAHQHARIAELEAKLEAICAGGVSGPLMGQPQAMPDLSALTERGAKAWVGVDAQGLREGRWYMVTHDGVATLCEDRRDAEEEAKAADMAWPYSGPHRAVQLVEASMAGYTAADMATAAAQGFRDGVSSLAANAGSELVAQPGDAEAILSKICDLFFIGKLARNESAILTNIRNVIDHAGLLHAVERDLFPQPELPEDDDPYAAVDEGLPAPNSWAAKDEADYVAQFRAALAARGFNAQRLRDGVASAGSEPVATVFTMEALAPGGGVKYHATVHKPLPAGTKLYLHHSPPEGMVMVPKEPTHHMINAAASAYKDARQSLGAYNAPWAAYRAMLEAAPPTTPAGSGKGE